MELWRLCSVFKCGAATVTKGVTMSWVGLVLLCILHHLFLTLHMAAHGLCCCVTWAYTEALLISGLMEGLS